MHSKTAQRERVGSACAARPLSPPLSHPRCSLPPSIPPSPSLLSPSIYPSIHPSAHPPHPSSLHAEREGGSLYLSSVPTILGPDYTLSRTYPVLRKNSFNDTNCMSRKYHACNTHGKRPARTSHTSAHRQLCPLSLPLPPSQCELGPTEKKTKRTPA